MKLVDILNEKVENVKWLGKAYEFASDHMFPLTPKIATILNKDRIVYGYHITSAGKVEQLKKLEGTKKSISIMRTPSEDAMGDLEGVWEIGVMYFLKGTLVLESRVDAMTVPDEEGRRWVEISKLDSPSADKLFEKFVNFLKKSKTLVSAVQTVNAEGLKSPKGKQALKQFLQTYVDLSTEFAEKNSKEIVQVMLGRDSNMAFLTNWDETVVNRIELLDVIYRESMKGTIFRGTYFDDPNRSQIKALKTSVSGTVTAIPADASDKKMQSIIEKFVFNTKVKKEKYEKQQK